MLERLPAVGRQSHLRLPGRRHQRAASSPSTRSATRSSSCRLRHEELAAFAACAHAKLTGEVGVCMATSGPGAIHLLNGLYDAKLDHAPGRRHRRPAEADVARRRLPAGGRPALALQGRRRRVSWPRCIDPRARPRTWSTARCASPRATRPSTAIIVPNDVQELRRTTSRRAPTARSTPAGRLSRRPVVRPTTRTCAAPPTCSTPGEQVAMLVGQGAKRRRPTRSSRSPTCSAPASPRRSTGAPSLPDDLPFVTGSIGLLGTKPSARHDGGLRHAAHGRLELPLLGVAARARPGARRADRHRRRACSASATRWRSTSSATPPRRCAR